ncbi:hypothetical protein M422DRAFT_231344 [Sphaerobolus stellatus SS14]|uniref:CHAT domain-containing protein n=1 Tax=Sphaerobolus stellatus (strain SS14) TaxID=990650 RepID=A0A0C9VKZ6_SPHS4|nr:hypothetical protein M422DRAFT_231344 [Sphaerobolus stellatus SS14]
MDAFDEDAKAYYLCDLGTSLSARFEQLGDLSDLEKAIAVQQEAVDLTDDDHPEKAGYLSHLGLSFQRRFGQLGDLSDIDQAIVVLQQAVNLDSDAYDNMANWLHNLGVSYNNRFRRLAELSDVEEAINVLQQAVNLSPEDSTTKAVCLNSLGNSFAHRFGQLGEISDIDNAIDAMEQAANLVPPSVNRAIACKNLSSLGNCLQIRFERLRELNDIDKAIMVHQQVIDLTPDGHPAKVGHISNLGVDFSTRFLHLGKLSDIDKAIALHQQAINLIPNGHYAFKFQHLQNIGIAFLNRFEQLGDVNDIDNSIKVMQQAINLVPDGHPGKASSLNTLGESFHIRFQSLHDLSDINNAVMRLQQAVTLTPDGHADKGLYLYTLGLGFQTRFEQLSEVESLASAINAYSQAAENASSSPLIRYSAALDWAVLCSANGTPSSALEAYHMVLEMIPQRVWLGQTVSHRYKELSNIGNVVNAAAAMAISAGNLALALEWLEEGRGIVWGQILQLQTPLDDLWAKYPDLARNLQKVSIALQTAGTSTIRPSLQNIDLERPQLTAEQEGQTHRALAAEHRMLLEQIRSLDGFENFLQPKKVSQLVDASTDGPVVIINVHASRCDALVLHCYNPLEPILHVPLQEFSVEQAERLYKQLNVILRGPSTSDNRKLMIAAIDTQTPGELFQSILGSLWSCVVQPIMLKINGPVTSGLGDCMPHITWCATGPLAFLPLHAAGIYGTEEQMKISDSVVSSYSPTLNNLLRPPPTYMENSPKVLIVSQPNTPGQHPLYGTLTEAVVIMKHTSAENTIHLNASQATVTKVLDEMNQNEWIHLACHGIQNTHDSLRSAFALHDGHLELQSLMRTSLKNAQLAFLSACQTATGDENLPEEAVHLAAGMLAAGFPSVVATMWSIEDKDAPIVAEAFYSSLLRNMGNSEGNNERLRVAYALHKAVKQLCEKVGEKNFVKWVPYVHFGL